MKKTPLVIAIAGILGASGASAASVEERLQRMEQRMQYLEQRVKEQDKVIAEKEAQIAEMQESSSTGGGWFQGVEIGGLVEVEGATGEDFSGADSSDIVLATAEIGMLAQINDITEAEIVLLYEDDGATSLDVDVARIGIAATEALNLDFGQMYVPFGSYATQMISDPLTLEIGETRESVAMATLHNSGVEIGTYIFNGETTELNDDDEIDNFGAFAIYSYEGDRFNIEGSLGYINDLTDSDALQDTIGGTVTDSVAAYTASAIVNAGPFTFIGEYLGASDDFGAGDLSVAGGEEPSAFNIEAGYNFELSGKEANIALGYQETEDAVALGLPEKRVLTAFSVAIMKNTSLAFEWAADEDYSVANGGTGNDADTFTTQLAVEF